MSRSSGPGEPRSRRRLRPARRRLSPPFRRSSSDAKPRSINAAPFRWFGLLLGSRPGGFQVHCFFPKCLSAGRVPSEPISDSLAALVPSPRCGRTFESGVSLADHEDEDPPSEPERGLHPAHLEVSRPESLDFLLAQFVHLIGMGSDGDHRRQKRSKRDASVQVID
jgi:hypothetical protein